MPSSCIGSIASSGKPPLPQIARTPYWRPSGSVKRTMRALVVVPMQIFSYLPLPSASSETLRTFGAVWSRNAPREVHRRLDALVEDADLRPVADADDVALHGHLVACAQLQDLLRVGDRERDGVVGHRLELPVEVDVAVGEMCAEARRAAQHW